MNKEKRISKMLSIIVGGKKKDNSEEILCWNGNEGEYAVFEFLTRCR